MTTQAVSAAPTGLRVGLLGYGEVGKRFGADLREGGVDRLSTFDLLLLDPNARAAMRDHARQHGIVPVDSTITLVERSDLIVSAVTAAEALNAARAAAATTMSGKWFLDINSTSPATKSECGRAVTAAGGRFVEAAVMTSVPPHGIRVPMLIGGPHVEELRESLTALGFNATPASGEIGVASAVKMCRSVVIKGMEAIVIESFTAARALGVEVQVLASLQETFPQIDWERQGDYFFSRVIQHGKRRAEEMQGSAETVASVGIDGIMADAASRRQAFIAVHKDRGTFSEPVVTKPWRERADELLRRIKRPGS
jgi:3-hydroxyisobutyrate dehydrogenase-like beta-hydroxyacid dehydrogenase